MTASLLRRMALGVVGLVATAAVSGCAGTYDSVLWRLLDAQESAAYSLIDGAKSSSATRDRFVADLIASPTFWDESAVPEVDPSAAVTFYYNVDDDPIDELVSFDVLVYSGLRPQDVPREDPAGSGGTYSGPPAIFTCYTLSVSFVDDRIRSQSRANDYGEELLTCPPELVDALAEGAQYDEPTEFDG